MHRTSWPWLRKLSHRWDPIKPAPPVTRYLAIVPSYRVIFEAKLLQIFRFVNIAAVKNDWLRQQAFDAGEVRTAKFIPLGENEQSRGALKRVVIALHVLNPLTKYFHCLRAGFRIEGSHRGAGGKQGLDDGDRRSVAHVIGSRLKGQTPHGESMAGQIGAEVPLHFVD